MEQDRYSDREIEAMRLRLERVEAALDALGESGLPGAEMADRVMQLYIERAELRARLRLAKRPV